MYFLDVTKKCQKLIISVDLAHLRLIIGRYLVAIWSLFLVLVAILWFWDEFFDNQSLHDRPPNYTNGCGHCDDETDLDMISASLHPNAPRKNKVVRLAGILT